MKSVKIDSLHMELFSGKKTKNLILDHLISEIGKYLKYIAECGYEGCHCLRNVSGNHFW